MKGQGLYALKKDCRELSAMCHDIQNRVTEKMCLCDKEIVEDAAHFVFRLDSIHSNSSGSDPPFASTRVRC